MTTIITVLYFLGKLFTYYRRHPIEITMTEYTKHKRDDDNWYSPPFYTGLGGYKMCINVAANGQGAGAGTHVSVHVHLMREEYDDWLLWPFLGDITILLVNQNDCRYYVKNTVHFCDPAVNSSQRVIARERAEFGKGFDQFISHLKLESTSAQCPKYDCLKFIVTEILIRSV